MRTPVILALGLVVFACTASSPEDAGPSEEEQRVATCTSDADCQRGVCDTAAKKCVDPWVLECAGITAGKCSPHKPYVCQKNKAPTYDCGRCGCPAGESCRSGVCLANDTIARQRQDRTIPDHLPAGEYFRFLDEMVTEPALPYDRGADDIVDRFRADSRRVVLNLGESHSSKDEQAVGLQLVRDLVLAGFPAKTIGVEGGTTPILDATPLADLGIRPLPISGDLTNVAYCAAAKREAAPLSNTRGIYVQYTGSGHTSQEPCHHVQHYPICASPHTADCVASIGRLAVTVILFDANQWLTTIDRTLLWRSSPKLPDVAAFEAELGTSLAAWKDHVALQRSDADFDATVSNRRVNVRFVQSPRFDDVVIAYFPRPGREPFLLRSFMAVWQKPDLRDFLLKNDIRPTNCSISWTSRADGSAYDVWCSKAGRELSAGVSADFVVVRSATN